MGSRDGNRRGHRYRPSPAFWIRLGLAANLLTPSLPDWAALTLGLLVLTLPARLFRP